MVEYSPRVVPYAPRNCGYEAYRGVDDPTELVLIERYLDDAALAAHLDSAHYQEVVVGRIRPVLTERRVELLAPRQAG
jgi:quinol monooxygenase YgiN